MSTYTPIIETILKINSNAKVVVKGNDINTCEIEWLENTTPIPVADIEAKMTELQAEYDANEYQRERATAYPSIGDQLDMLWHSIDQNPSLKSEYFDFYEAIKSVKIKHPKNG